MRICLTELAQPEYVHSAARAALYEELSKKHREIYIRRVRSLEKLRDCEYSHITKHLVERWIDDIRNFNDEAQQAYDSFFDKLVQESDSTNEKS